MTYYHDHYFDDPEKLIDFFLRHKLFLTFNKYDANHTGKGGMIFRGQSNADWPLISSAFRPGRLKSFTPQPPDDEFDTKNIRRHMGSHLHAEARAIYIFMEAADSIGIPTPLDYTTTTYGLDLILAALNDNDTYDYKQPFPTADFQRATALAQHHGVPTRFLDWTESPLVACYFAAIGASSFAQKTPDVGQELVIAFLSTDALSRESSPAELVKAPRHENSHLRQQQGIFTNVKHANEFFLGHGRWPSLDDLSTSDFQLHRARLPAERADDLLRELFDLKISRHSLMPSLSNAASAYEYTHVLYGRGMA